MLSFLCVVPQCLPSALTSECLAYLCFQRVEHYSYSKSGIFLGGRWVFCLLITNRTPFTWMKTERTPIFWFIPLMLAVARTRPSQSWKKRNPLLVPHGVTGLQLLESCFLSYRIQVTRCALQGPGALALCFQPYGFVSNLSRAVLVLECTVHLLFHSAGISCLCKDLTYLLSCNQTLIVRNILVQWRRTKLNRLLSEDFERKWAI